MICCKATKRVRGMKEMHIKAGIQKEKIFSLSLYCLFVMFMIFVIGNKRNLHVDEAFSYGLANHDGMAVNIEGGGVLINQRIEFGLNI